MNNLNENIIAGVIATIIGGLLLYGFQIVRENRKEKRLDREKNKIGKIKRTYIDEGFLENYLPGGLSIEKILEDFGQPDQKYDMPVFTRDSEKIDTAEIYEYKLKNAVILFSTFRDSHTVISISLNAVFDKRHPVKSPYTFDDGPQYFGKAKITNEILANQIHFEHHGYPNWVYAAVQSRYFNRQINHLFFTYTICSTEIQTVEDMAEKVIDQICISVNENVHPIINFFDMIPDL